MTGNAAKPGGLIMTHHALLVRRRPQDTLSNHTLSQVCRCPQSAMM